MSAQSISGRTGPVLRGLLSVLCLALALLSLSGTLDERAQNFVDQGLQRSLVIFAVARGLNAVISVAQGTELALQPAGVGVTLTPGEILDPINDLIERFSWLMLSASAIFGVQEVVLRIGAWTPFAVLAGVLLAVAALAPWRQLPLSTGWRQALFKVAVLLAFLRFTIPLTALASDLIYQHFLAPSYESASAGLEHAGRELETLNEAPAAQQPPEENRAWWERLRDGLDVASASLDLQARLDRYRQAVEHSVRQTVDLIVIFAMQTLVIPLLVIAGAWQGFKLLLSRRLSWFD